jgi:hypothetical protein
VLRSWVRRQRAAAWFGLQLITVGLVTFAAGNLNTWLYATKHGANSIITQRALPDLMTWGLRVPDLFLPIEHPVEAWEKFAKAHYFDVGNTVTENYMAFLGAVGCLLLTVLVVVSVRHMMAGRWSEVSAETWIVAYTLVYSLAGGLNYMVGALGFTWLRGTNRYSIVILCAVLLWASRAGARFLPRFVGPVLAVALAVIGLLECFGMRLPETERDARQAKVAALVKSDREVVLALGRALPRTAAVFQLPVMQFPEAPGIAEMLDYEPFRPFLWSETLRFSYGSHKGRARDAWQSHTEALDPASMVRYLGTHGFSALLINRRGYPDHARQLEEQLASLGIPLLVEARAKDLVAYRLQETGGSLPSSLGLGTGWWGWEAGTGGRWSWSKGSAELVLITTPDGLKRTVKFDLESLKERRLVVKVVGRTLKSLTLAPRTIEHVSITIEVGSPETHIQLMTDAPAERPPNADTRPMAFRVINPEIIQ